MGNKIISFIKKYWPYPLLVLIVILIFRHFFLDTGLVTYTDTAPFNINMSTLKDFATQLWVTKYTGWLYSSLPATIQNFFSLNIIYSVINYFAHNVYINNTLWVFLPYPILAVSVFVFIKNFAKNNLAAFVATLIYVFSYVFFMWFISSGSNILVWAVSASIVFCHAFINILGAESLKDKFKYTLMGAIASIVAISNIAYFFVFVIFIALFYALSALYKTKKQNIGEFIKAVYFGSAVLIANLFWIAPIYFMRGGDSITFGGNTDPLLAYHSMCATPVRNIMYMFCGALPSERLLYSILFLSIFSVIAFFTLRGKENTKKILLALFLGFYVISLGLNTPFWKIVSHLPGAFLFRTPQRVYEVMLLILVTLLATIIVEMKNKSLLILALALIVVCAVPYKYMNENGSNMKDNIPNSYTAAADYLAQNNNGLDRVLIYPDMPNFMARTWQKTKRISPPIIDFFINERSVMYWLGGDSVPTALKPLFSDQQLKKNNYDYEKIIGFFNMGYVLTQNDIKPEYASKQTDGLNSFGASMTDNRIVYNSSELNIYRVQEEKIKPTIYSTKLVKKYSNDEELFELIDSEKVTTTYTKENVQDQKYSAYNTTYQKLSNTKYEAKVSGTGGKTILVFQEYFHPGWKVYYDGTPLDENVAKHIRVNGFENAWIINTDAIKATSGGYNFQIKYEPQKYFDIFVKVMYGFIALLAAGYVWQVYKDRSKK